MTLMLLLLRIMNKVHKTLQITASSYDFRRFTNGAREVFQPTDHTYVKSKQSKAATLNCTSYETIFLTLETGSEYKCIIVVLALLLAFGLLQRLADAWISNRV